MFRLLSRTIYIGKVSSLSPVFTTMLTTCAKQLNIAVKTAAQLNAFREGAPNVIAFCVEGNTNAVTFVADFFHVSPIIESIVAYNHPQLPQV